MTRTITADGNDGEAAPAQDDRTAAATWFVYLLRCADGTFYSGITTDLARRLAEHNAGPAGARYTRSRRPVSLAWSEPAADRGAASRREHAVRRLARTAKQALADGAPAPVPDGPPTGQAHG